MELLARYWWVLVVRGVAAVLFGLVALIWPDITLWVLVLLFGAYALVDGVFALGAAVARRDVPTGQRVWLVIEGIAGIAAAVAAVFWPSITALALLLLISAWAVVTGVLEIVAAIQLRRELTGEWLLALSGVLSVLFGLLLLIRPAEGAIAVVWLIGIYAIVFGVALVALGLRLRRPRRGTVPGAHRPATA